MRGGRCRDEVVGRRAGGEGDTVDFSRDIRPILSESCFGCHGPDGESRQAELRLDRRESAMADPDGHPVITPGNPDKSEHLRRVLAENPDERMPPVDSGKTLTAQQIETLDGGSSRAPPGSSTGRSSLRNDRKSRR